MAARVCPKAASSTRRRTGASYARRRPRAAQHLVFPETVQIALRQLPPPLIETIESGKLGEPQRGADIGQVHFSAPLRDVHVAGGVALDTVKANAFEVFDELGVTAGHRAAFNRGHVLIGVEAEAHRITRGADFSPLVRGPDRVGRVLDHQQPPARRPAHKAGPSPRRARRNGPA